MPWICYLQTQMWHMLYYFLIKRFNYPISSCDTGDYFVGQRTNRIAEAVHDLFQTCKDLVSEAALADLFPNLLYGIHLRCVRRDMEQLDVLRNLQCARLVPCCTVAAQQDDIVRVFFGQIPQKNIHADGIALRKHQKEVVSRQRFHSTKGIVILPDVVTGHTGAHPLFTPAVFRLVNPTEACFILEHQPNYFAAVDNFQFFDSGLNFFEASIVSSLAFLGCLLRGMILRHPWRCRTK